MFDHFDLLISGVSGFGIGTRCCLNLLDCGIGPMLVVCSLLGVQVQILVMEVEMLGRTDTGTFSELARDLRYRFSPHHNQSLEHLMVD